MRRISGYIISIAASILLMQGTVDGQDTINFPLRTGAGIALNGPVSALAGKYPGGLEFNGFLDINERLTIAADGGYSSFVHQTYNYSYKNNGFYLRAGSDYNLLNPVLAAGRYFAGLSLRYGLSLYSHSNSSIEYDNYWGSFLTSEGNSFHAAHFVEISPGVRAELFKNFYIGWSVNARILLWSGSGDHMRAIDIPGFGNGSKPFSSGFNYYLSIRIPYKTKRVIYVKPEREPEEESVSGSGQPVRNQ